MVQKKRSDLQDCASISSSSAQLMRTTQWQTSYIDVDLKKIVHKDFIDDTLQTADLAISAALIPTCKHLRIMPIDLV